MPGVDKLHGASRVGSRVGAVGRWKLERWPLRARAKPEGGPAGPRRCFSIFTGKLKKIKVEAELLWTRAALLRRCDDVISSSVNSNQRHIKGGRDDWVFIF